MNPTRLPLPRWDGGFVYPQEEKLDLATIRRWRSEAITAPAQDRLWLNRCEALCNQLLRTGAFDE